MTVYAFQKSLCPVCARPCEFATMTLISERYVASYICDWGHRWEAHWSGPPPQPVPAAWADRVAVED